LIGVRRRFLLLLAIIAALLGAGWFLLLRDPPLNLPQLDRIVVHKAARRMELFAEGKLVHTITGIQLGNAPIGHKQFEGDEKTPEGRYVIDLRNPRSKFNLSLRISYPDPAARTYAATQQRSAGGDIFIHGQPNGLPIGRVPGDWTDGCVAVSNREIEALWRVAPLGTPVEIVR
jgi:murein L,D-transpeptidase YafK